MEATYVHVLTTIVQVLAVWTVLGAAAAFGIARWMHSGEVEDVI